MPHGWYWLGYRMPKSLLRSDRNRPIQSIPVYYDEYPTVPAQKPDRMSTPAPAPAPEARESIPTEPLIWPQGERERAQPWTPSSRDRATAAPRRCCCIYCIGHEPETAQKYQADECGCLKCQPWAQFELHPAHRHPEAPVRADPDTARPAPSPSARASAEGYREKSYDFHIPTPATRKANETARSKTPRTKVTTRPDNLRETETHSRSPPSYSDCCPDCLDGKEDAGAAYEPNVEMAEVLCGDDGHQFDDYLLAIPVKIPSARLH
ncbi:hypothetical protein N7468_007203 [Penicillium chermesinum]|uniref:Uncharacterized protein n=1 Tax=Penicillium chermesinum TaxID=63820 RepID=A0A9W9TKF8_9EURO|nr:uncharacterized protein N7468_007203 [Penicillium chermesinum]KAJ5225978.1 hypothetical protein N7468_007203 [Penicillium chermesinum]